MRYVEQGPMKSHPRSVWSSRLCSRPLAESTSPGQDNSESRSVSFIGSQIPPEASLPFSLFPRGYFSWFPKQPRVQSRTG